MHFKANLQNFLFIAVNILLCLPLVLYSRLYFLRPPLTNDQRELFRGIVYQRYIKSIPRPVMIHIVTIDLTAPGIKPFVTPGLETLNANGFEAKAQTTSDFLSKYKLQLAVNGSYFYPFRENTPWDYYPHSGDRVNILGQNISNRKVFSKPERNWRVLCFAANNQAQIPNSEVCPPDTIQGVAGSEILILRGKPQPNLENPNKDKPYPRVVAAIDRKGEKLWLILVDGKQPLYSEGLTKAELTKFVLGLGVDTALNLDGGGSTTVAIASPTNPKILNAVIHTKLPMRERPVANHLGFYAVKL
jgi:Phosphodiester glycosidase